MGPDARRLARAGGLALAAGALGLIPLGRAPLGRATAVGAGVAGAALPVIGLVGAAQESAAAEGKGTTRDAAPRRGPVTTALLLGTLGARIGGTVAAADVTRMVPPATHRRRRRRSPSLGA